MTNKEAAEKRREKVALIKKRKELKAKIAEKRAANLVDDEFNGYVSELEGINSQVDDIDIQLSEAPEEVTGQRWAAFMQSVPQENKLTKENFRSSPEYRAAFYRSVVNKSIAQQDAEIMAFGKRAITDMNGNSVTSGAAYLVPETTLNTIKSIVTKYGQVYAAITKYQFEGDVSIPIGTEDSTTNEADGTDTLAFIFTEVKLSQMAIIGNVVVKNLLMKNAISAFEIFISMEIGKYIGLQLENYVINGSGEGGVTFTGIVTGMAGDTHTYTEVDFDLICDVEAAVESPYGDQATWIMRRATFFSKFRKGLVDTNGNPLVTVVQGVPGSPTYYIDGRPVMFSSKVAANAFIYYDLSDYVVNESQEVVIESDPSPNFQKDETVFRGKVYAGGSPCFATTAGVYYTYDAGE